MKTSRSLLEPSLLAALLSMSGCGTVAKSDALQRESPAAGSTAKPDSARRDPAAGGSALPEDSRQRDSTARAAVKIPSPEKEESIFEGKSIEIKVEEALIMNDDFYNVAVSSPLPGVILLEGKVRTEKDKARAETIAASIRGVVVVTNRLAVTGR